jgi:hypothetical protein
MGSKFAIHTVVCPKIIYQNAGDDSYEANELTNDHVSSFADHRRTKESDQHYHALSSNASVSPAESQIVLTQTFVNLKSRATIMQEDVNPSFLGKAHRNFVMEARKRSLCSSPGA